MNTSLNLNENDGINSFNSSHTLNDSSKRILDTSLLGNKSLNNHTVIKNEDALFNINMTTRDAHLTYYYTRIIVGLMKMSLVGKVIDIESWLHASRKSISNVIININKILDENKSFNKGKRRSTSYLNAFITTAEYEAIYEQIKKTIDSEQENDNPAIVCTLCLYGIFLLSKVTSNFIFANHLYDCTSSSKSLCSSLINMVSVNLDTLVNEFFSYTKELSNLSMKDVLAMYNDKEGKSGLIPININSYLLMEIETAISKAMVEEGVNVIIEVEKVKNFIKGLLHQIRENKGLFINVATSDDNGVLIDILMITLTRLFNSNRNLIKNVNDIINNIICKIFNMCKEQLSIELEKLNNFEILSESMLIKDIMEEKISKLDAHYQLNNVTELEEHCIVLINKLIILPRDNDNEKLTKQYNCLDLVKECIDDYSFPGITDVDGDLIIIRRLLTFMRRLTECISIPFRMVISSIETSLNDITKNLLITLSMKEEKEKKGKKDDFFKLQSKDVFRKTLSIVKLPVHCIIESIELGLGFLKISDTSMQERLGKLSVYVNEKKSMIVVSDTYVICCNEGLADQYIILGAKASSPFKSSEGKDDKKKRDKEREKVSNNDRVISDSNKVDKNSIINSILKSDGTYSLKVSGNNLFKNGNGLCSRFNINDTNRVHNYGLTLTGVTIQKYNDISCFTDMVESLEIIINDIFGYLNDSLVEAYDYERLLYISIALKKCISEKVKKSFSEYYGMAEDIVEIENVTAADLQKLDLNEYCINMINFKLNALKKNNLWNELRTENISLILSLLKKGVQIRDIYKFKSEVYTLDVDNRFLVLYLDLKENIVGKYASTPVNHFEAYFGNDNLALAMVKPKFLRNDDRLTKSCVLSQDLISGLIIKKTDKVLSVNYQSHVLAAGVYPDLEFTIKKFDNQFDIPIWTTNMYKNPAMKMNSLIITYSPNHKNDILRSTILYLCYVVNNCKDIYPILSEKDAETLGNVIKCNLINIFSNTHYKYIPTINKEQLYHLSDRSEYFDVHQERIYFNYLLFMLGEIGLLKRVLQDDNNLINEGVIGYPLFKKERWSVVKLYENVIIDKAWENTLKKIKVTAEVYRKTTNIKGNNIVV